MSESQESFTVRPPVSIHPQYYIFEVETKEIFMEWWSQTKWVSNLQSDPKKKAVKWGSVKLSATWKDFYEVANIQTGEPKVLCRICKQIIQHPHTTSNGTSALGNHVASSRCQQVAVAKGDKAISTYLLQVSVTLHVECTVTNICFTINRTQSRNKYFQKKCCEYITSD